MLDRGFDCSILTIQFWVICEHWVVFWVAFIRDLEENGMARVCDICDKGTTFGNSVPRKGLPKKEGGAGQHVVKRVPRSFKPNLLKITGRYRGKVQKMKICTRCLKAGLVEKIV